MSARRSLATIVAALALLIAGCGSDEDGNASAASPVSAGANADAATGSHATAASDATADSKGAGLIVFERLHPGSGTVRLYTIRPDGSGLETLTRPRGGADEDSQAKLSPDGRRIVFRRFFDRGLETERTEVMVVERDGTGLRNLTQGSCTGDCLGSEEPAWSPDGKQIVFMRALGPISADGFPAVVGLFVMDADGSNVRQLTQLEPNSGTEDHVPDWSPDGERIAFMRWSPDGASAIHTVAVDGTDLTRIRKMPARWPGSGVPRWSPNGSRILSDTYCLFGDCGQPSTGSQLFTIKADGSGYRRLTDVPGNAFDGAWSPNGRRIVFARNQAVLSRGDLFVMRATGTKVRRLTNQPALDSHNPDWSK